MRIIACQKVPVEPGISLETDVYLPDGGGRHPVVLIRTPYDRTGQAKRAAYFASYGYAVVVQDVRGRYASEGVFRPVQQEEADGHAVLDWIANESWCDGRIGMWGVSYVGMVQWYAALSGHEALRCIAPSVAPGSYFHDWPRRDGCFAWANLVRWMQTWAVSRTQPPLSHIHWERLWSLRDLQSVQEACGFLSPAFESWVKRDQEDRQWLNIDVRHRASELRIPILHSAGWWDHLSGTHLHLMSRADQVPGRQYLMVGPWGHNPSGARCGGDQTRAGVWSFPDSARFDMVDRSRRFFDLYLRDDDRSFGAEPACRAYVMGADRWIDSPTWPVEGTVRQTWHLGGDGRADSDQGTLSPQPPPSGGQMTYRYDPADPAPTRGGPIYWGLDEAFGCGPVDCRSFLNRRDVAVFRSAPLDEPMTILGPAELQLTVAMDVPDTDIIARLAVEDPMDGAVYPLLVGSLRLRYRDSFADPQPVELNTPTTITINLGSTGYQFPAGSRLVLAVAGSDCPHLLPHTNRFDSPLGLHRSSAGDVATVHLLIGADGLGCRLNLTLVSA